jgi:hypothetical protein
MERGVFATLAEIDSAGETAESRGESVSAAVHRILRSALLKQNVEKQG